MYFQEICQSVKQASCNSTLAEGGIRSGLKEGQ